MNDKENSHAAEECVIWFRKEDLKDPVIISGITFFGILLKCVFNNI